MTPYYNWQYAKKNGFIKWLILGEVVATIKSTVWPYFMFFSSQNPNSKIPSGEHFANAKDAGNKAMKIIFSTDGILHISPENKNKVLSLLEFAIAEANKVPLGDLQKIHSEFPRIYEKNYKDAINQIIDGLKTNNKYLILIGSYKYNEFVDWMRDKKTEKDSQVKLHFVKAYYASTEALSLLGAAPLSSTGKKNSLALLKLASNEANQVSVDYLRKIHPDFPQIYEKHYKFAIDQLIIGLETNNMQALTAGVNAQNKLIQWTRNHPKVSSFLRDLYNN